MGLASDSTSSSPVDDMAYSFDRMQNQFREIDNHLNAMLRETDRLRGEVDVPGQGRGRTYRKENSSEEKTTGGYKKSYYSESVTYFGDGGSQHALARHGVAGFLFPAVVCVSALSYVAGIAALFAAFDKTAFKSQSKAKLAMLWPVWFLTSAKFRSEFRKAMRDRSASVSPPTTISHGEDE